MQENVKNTESIRLNTSFIENKMVIKNDKALDKDEYSGKKKKRLFGHDQLMETMFSLLDYTEDFHKELTEVSKKWDNAKADNKRIYDVTISDVKKEQQQIRNDFFRSFKLRFEENDKRKNNLNKIFKACNEFFLGPAGYTARETIKRKYEVVVKAIESKKNAYSLLKRCQIAEAEKPCNAKLDKARDEQIKNQNQIEYKFDEEYKRICDKGSRDIKINFNNSNLHEYRQEIMSKKFNVVNYEVPIEVPDYVVLGDINLTIHNITKDERAVVRALRMQTSDIFIDESSTYTINLPYVQRLSEGISLLMRYFPSDKKYVQGLMEPLLLKLFMSFPAGKLEATMIDPLELGGSFPNIPKLAEGPNTARIIDTRIWGKEKDIEIAITNLRQWMENITQAYGGDQKSRLKKEPIKALFITDFPFGFSDNALKDLNAIVRKSASLGVCVLISANDEELKKLKERNGTLVDEITQSMLETQVSGHRLMPLGKNTDRIFIELDEMRDVFERKDEVLSLVRDAIDHMSLPAEKFCDMYNNDIYDSNEWFNGNQEEIAIPIGIKGSNTIINMVLGRDGGNTEHHALISGLTGAGKTTLLHTLIMSTLISYKPEEVQMYLLDFKEGVEFNVYTRYRLPSLRVVALNSEREFALIVLKELCEELMIRSQYFNKYGVSDIISYNKILDAPKVPKLLLIFDEIQELFRDRNESDSISNESLSCINKIVMQGRAMGVHVILACQDFHNCAGLEAYFSQMKIRIAIKGTENGASSILDPDNKGIRILQNSPAGSAIYNGGGGFEAANNVFRITVINEDERKCLLTRLNEYFMNPVVAKIYENNQTRILLANARDNIQNCFNKIISEGASSIKSLGSSQDDYGLFLGLSFGKKSAFIPEFRLQERDNLLVVSKDEKMALSLFEFSTMSVLYEELLTHSDKTNALVYIVDLCNNDELSEQECSFDFLASKFNQQVTVVKKNKSKELIANLYKKVIERSKGINSSVERIFFMFFGINRARSLTTGSIYEEDQNGEPSPIEMLQKILIKGPIYGINSIVWGESIRSIELMLGNQYESMFDKRIAYKLDEDSMNILVAESAGKELTGKTAVYMDMEEDIKNTHFRPYNIPDRKWIEDYAEIYEKIINLENR